MPIGSCSQATYVATKQIYVHTQPSRRVSISLVAGLMMVIVLPIIENLRPRLYLDNPSDSFKFSLLIMSMFTSFSPFLLVLKKKYEPTLEEYLKEHLNNN